MVPPFDVLDLNSGQVHLGHFDDGAVLVVDLQVKRCVHIEHPAKIFAFASLNQLLDSGIEVLTCTFQQLDAGFGGDFEGANQRVLVDDFKALHIVRFTDDDVIGFDVPDTRFLEHLGDESRLGFTLGMGQTDQTNQKQHDFLKHAFKIPNFDAHWVMKKQPR